MPNASGAYGSEQSRMNPHRLQTILQRTSNVGPPHTSQGSKRGAGIISASASRIAIPVRSLQAEAERRIIEPRTDPRGEIAQRSDWPQKKQNKLSAFTRVPQRGHARLTAGADSPAGGVVGGAGRMNSKGGGADGGTCGA